MNIRVEISPGELIDKMTILEIKAEQIKDKNKLANVTREYQLLKAVYETEIVGSEQLRELTAALKAVNRRLWDIEDDIRDQERAQSFGERFVELARSVYRTNDQRSVIKSQINKLLDSPIHEEKSYADY